MVHDVKASISSRFDPSHPPFDLPSMETEGPDCPDSPSLRLPVCPDSPADSDDVVMPSDTDNDPTLPATEDSLDDDDHDDVDKITSGGDGLFTPAASTTSFLSPLIASSVTPTPSSLPMNAIPPPLTVPESDRDVMLTPTRSPDALDDVVHPTSPQTAPAEIDMNHEHDVALLPSTLGAATHYGPEQPGIET